MSTLLTTSDAQAIIVLDRRVKAGRAEIIEAKNKDNGLLEGLLVARFMRALEGWLTDAMMSDVMALCGSPIGFRTDRDSEDSKPKYTVAEVRRCFITSLVRGFRPVGNEWNIISGNFYAAQAGLWRVVTTWPGLTDLRLRIDTPTYNADRTGALVNCSATWRLDGQADYVECLKSDTRDERIPVRVNSKSIVDAVKGKAKRKLLALIYERLDGSAISECEVGEEPEPETIAALPEISPSADTDVLPKSADVLPKPPPGQPDGWEPPAECPLTPEEKRRDKEQAAIAVEDVARAIASAFVDMDRITDVNLAERSWLETDGLTGDQVKMIGLGAEAARDRIRARRGTRSNV